MTTATITPTFTQRIFKVWDQLTAPKSFVPQADHRRVRLLCSTLLVFVVAAVMITTVLPALSGKPLAFMFVAPVAFYFGMFFLSRTKYYKQSAILFIVILNVVVWGSALALTTSDILPFLAIIAVLAGIVLSTRGTAILIVLNFIGLVAGSILQKPLHINPIMNFTLAISFFLAFFGLFLVLVRYRDLIEKDRVAEALKAEEQRRAVEELRALDQIKSKFLASMSHELRTPLNSVLNFTEFVLNGVYGPVNDEQAEALKTVVSSGDFLLGLINDVLDMTKIESGALELFIEQVDLNEVITASLDMTKGLLGDKPVALVEHIAPDLPTISGDRRRIQQILNNLLSNAVKFTVNGSITLDVVYDGNTAICLTVRDTGAGIALTDKDVIFQPFRQTKQGVQQGSGTGLGLPISRSLAEAHGGKLTMESTVGQGSAFHVTLPLKARESAAA